MKHTQEQLELMSNLEINLIVAKIKGDLIDIPFEFKGLICGDKHCYYDDLRNIWECHPDYCDDWSECGVLIDNSGIIADGNGSAFVVFDNTYKYIVNCDVMRAVAIIYILVKQES